MSNRLRASMRAGNKGRSLRPRTSTSRNSAVPPESDLATSDLQADAIARDAAAESDASDGLDAPESVQPAAPPPVSAAAAARLTPAEVLAAGRAFSHQHEDDDHEEVAPSTKAAVPIARAESDNAASSAPVAVSR